MPKLLDRCARRINDSFPDMLKAAFLEKFGRELSVDYNIVAMQLVSKPADGEPYTPEQQAWASAFDAGYWAAQGIVLAASNGD